MSNRIQEYAGRALRSLGKKEGISLKKGREGKQSQDHKSTGVVSHQSSVRVKMYKICKHYCAK